VSVEPFTNNRHNNSEQEAMNTMTIHTGSDAQELVRALTAFNSRMQHLDRCLEGLKVPESGDTAHGLSSEPDPEIVTAVHHYRRRMQHLADTMAKD